MPGPESSGGFVVWDTSTPGLRIALESLSQRSLQVPALGGLAGDVHRLSIADGVAAHRRIFVFTDLPNVNVGYELGHALADEHKRIALCYSGARRPGWLKTPPLVGLVAHAIRSPDQLLALGEGGFMPGLGAQLAGSDRLLLCPKGIEGSPLVSTVRAAYPGVRELDEQGWNTTQLPALLRGVGQVIWVLTVHNEGEAARDGTDNARHAVVAGFAERCGATLHVLISSGVRPIADLDSRARRFDSLESFRRELGRALGEPDAAKAKQPAPVSGLLDFGPLVRQSSEDYVGRSWLADELDTFLKAQDRGYATILALPGMGKTAFAAHLVRRHAWPHHFNSRRLGVVSFADFQRNLRAQLVRAHGLDLQAPAEADQHNGLYLAAMLDAAGRQLTARGQRATIVVDGLDESEPGPEGTQPLFLPAALPPGIRIVALGRPDPIRRLVTEPPTQVLTIDPADERNVRDIRAFLRGKARGVLAPLLAQRGRSERWFVDAVHRASEGNFMYARCVVNDLLADSDVVPDLARLPRGLSDYYERHWQSIVRAAGAGGWAARLLMPTLCVLSVTEVPLTLAEVEAVLRVGFPDLGEAGAIETSAALDRWGQFLVREPTVQGPAFQIYHKSFQDFLRGKPEVGSELARRNAAAWLSEAALGSLLGGDAPA